MGVGSLQVRGVSRVAIDLPVARCLSRKSCEEPVEVVFGVELGHGDEEVLAPRIVEAAEVDARKDALLGELRGDVSGVAGMTSNDELVEDRSGIRNLEAVERVDRRSEVMGSVEATPARLLEPLTAEQRRAHRHRKGDETVIGADVRGRLLAPDVLLPSR